MTCFDLSTYFVSQEGPLDATVETSKEEGGEENTKSALTIGVFMILPEAHPLSSCNDAVRSCPEPRSSDKR